MVCSNSYKIIKYKYITEKSNVLQSLHQSDSNRCLKKCNHPKYVFIVDRKANKTEIAKAIEDIYSEKNIKVKSVNTILVKPKKRRVRGKVGFKPFFKKAIVTLEVGDVIESEV